MNNEKQVVLAKTEYDAMEKELDGLRGIVNNRTVSKIFVPHAKYQRIKHLYSIESCDLHYPLETMGTMVQYVLGTDGDSSVSELSEIISKMDKEKKDFEDKYDVVAYELRNLKAKEEIRIYNLTWFDKLLRRK